MPCKSLPGMMVTGSTERNGWSNVDAVVLDGRPDAPFAHQSEAHHVAFLLRGSAKVEWKSPGRFLRHFCNPGSFTIVPAGSENEFLIDRPVQLLVWRFVPAMLDRVASDAWDEVNSSIDLSPVANKRDNEIWSLGQRLAGFIQEPVTGSRLYAETLQTQLLIQLLWNHSSLRPREATEPAGNEGQRFKRVLEYIQSSLGDEVSLNDLADVAGYSPNYFLGAFKRATGQSPHIYLTEQRITRACELLLNPHRSIVSVALEVGFSSQSHFTSVFRRLRKTTPAAYRRELLGLNADDAALEVSD